MRRNRLIWIFGACSLLLVLVFALSWAVVEASEKEDEDGNSKEETVLWNDVPTVVQGAFKAALAGSTPTEVTREAEKGIVLYEALVKTPDSERAVKAAENGELLETEETLSVSALPEAVSAQVGKHYPKGEITKVERITLSFYEVEVTQGKGKHEVAIFGSGQPVPMED